MSSGLPQESSSSTTTPASTTQTYQTHRTFPLALPPPETPKELVLSTHRKLDVSGEGETMKFDELGPMVVNSDGTLSRIANWQNMTEGERERTVKVLVARNKI
ncbi:hypothetical protein BDY19DRAFT_952666 [Irpex rosettiformis]|uniref:Uncharacterized protein n=1 Tax=Irpex rosettiformis TaxID=378272 RepID=A0ACB8U079_9APHY|nr:hypothetical protein BDY19DRAFT_952666 [Irpex rosettiformis]